MLSTFGSELNNLIAFFTRSILTFEIRKLHFRRYSATITSLQQPYSRAVTYNIKPLTSPRLQQPLYLPPFLPPSTQRQNINRHTSLPQEPPDEQ